MLAKQGWRLWENPDSLCVQFLKAEYFPNSTILEAKPKAAMLYTWRSVLRDIELVKKGMIWRVGDGVGLKIWDDPWLPRGFSRRPSSPRGACLLPDVDELIDPVSGSWDVDLVKDIFREEDAAIILALPVNQGRANTLAWHFDNHGRFSVKSAYKVCRVDILRNRVSAGQQGRSGMEFDGVWKKIWQVKCPHKIKHFLWRMAHNSHPLQCNLAQRGMHIDIKCPVCGCIGEDGGHLFFKCKLAKQL